MIKNTLFFISTLFILACQGIEIIDPETGSAVARTCEVTNPLKDLPWLEAAKPDDGLYCSLWQVI